MRALRDGRLDSMGILMNEVGGPKNTAYIYFVAVTAARTRPHRFLPNDGTMQQLKNAGAFRLVRNPVVRDDIARYDVAVRNYLKQGEVEEGLIETYRAAASRIFDSRLYDQMLDSNMNVTRHLQGEPALLHYSKNDLNEFNYRLFSMKAINKANRRDGRLLRVQAEKLIELLQHEYHIK